MKTIDAYSVNSGSRIVLNANECYKNLPKDIIDEIKENLDEVMFNRYPDNNASSLTKTYSKVFNIDEDCVMFGNGSDEMLGLIIGLNIKKGKKLYTLSPDFSMYDYYASFHEGDMIKFSLELGKEFNVDNFIELGKKENISFVVFSNPNNPTGSIVSKESIIEILKSFKGIPVVIDEAYGEFTNESMIDYIKNYSNLYVTKTLSKAYGVAGIRLGMIISNKENINKLKEMKVPFNVNSITQYIGLKVLNHKKELDKYSNEIVIIRDEFYNRVVEKDYKDLILYESHANFIYGKSSIKDLFIGNLENEGISIRNYSDDSFRITIGSDEEMKEVLDIIDKTFGGCI